MCIRDRFAAMENHRTDSIPNDSYPVKSDRLLENGFGSQPRSKVQRSVSGCCKFRALSCGKIATESRSRWDGGGGRVTANQRSPVLQSGPSYASEFGRTLSLVRQWHHVHLRSLVDIARDRRLRRFRHLITVSYTHLTLP